MICEGLRYKTVVNKQNGVITNFQSLVSIGKQRFNNLSQLLTRFTLHC